jgi:hypothetical protein
MLGLAGDGYPLADYHQHAAGYLKSRGYETALSGVQHVARDPPRSAPGFPGAKKTLTDRGTGVMLILRGPGVPAGRRQSF